LLGQMMKAAVDKGSIFVAAAGNAGAKSPPLYPAAEDTVIAVTAVDAKRKIYKRANRGTYIDIGAPGVDVIALAPGNATALSSGTSIATAHITGLLALAFERAGHFNLVRAQELLVLSAEKIEAPADSVGAGLANAPLLLTKAAETPPEETQ
jgi:subtilisin family serine protease